MKKILVLLIALILILGSVGYAKQKSEEINSSKIEVIHAVNGIVVEIEQVALGEAKPIYSEGSGVVLSSVVKEEGQIIYRYDYK